MKITHLSQLVSDYDAYIVDLWGVMHNGRDAFPEAILALAELKLLKKKIILLSNSPRRVDSSRLRLTELGILPEFYDLLYTSGEDCFQALETPSEEWYRQLGAKYFLLGPNKDKSMAQNLSRINVDNLDDADFVLVTGTNGWEANLNAYIPFLEKARKKNLPMVCANPDLTVFFENELVICAGAIAQAYEEMGGDVRYHGKPYPDIYTAILKKIDMPKDRILAIGDSLRTDIKGAAQMKIDTLLVLSGIHGEFQDEPYEAIRNYGLDNFQIEPKYIATKLVF